MEDKICIPMKTLVFDQEHCTASAEVAQQGTPGVPSNRISYPSILARKTSSIVGRTTLASELKAVLNKFCEENNSNTPDFILANFLINALDAFNAAIQAREKWYGRKVFNEST